MADKRYQVFVSSTYEDLQEERWEAVKVLMTMDCIVAGMEYFPAVDEEQFEYIKEIIDDCDYYILILGGRYGSLASDGISYTEKEYNYAISKGIKVIALVHNAPDTLPPEKREIEPDQLKKYHQFRDNICKNRLVSFWDNVHDIQKNIALGMAMAIKKFPAVGWVRATAAASEELLNEINKLRKENDELKYQSSDVTLIQKIDRGMTISYSTESEEKLYIEMRISEIFNELYAIFLEGVEFRAAYKCIDRAVSKMIEQKENKKGISISHSDCSHIISLLKLLNIIQEGSFHDDDINFSFPNEGYVLTELGKKMCIYSLFHYR